MNPAAKIIITNGHRRYGRPPRVSKGTMSVPCPACGNEFSEVLDARLKVTEGQFRRRRCCVACWFLYTTFERLRVDEALTYEI